MNILLVEPGYKNKYPPLGLMKIAAYHKAKGHSVCDWCLALSILNAKYTQYSYAKTVNLIRRYFADEDSNLEPYLFLPITSALPEYRKLGFVQYQVIIISLIAIFYFIVGLMQLKFDIANVHILSFLYSLALILTFANLYQKAKNKSVQSGKK